MTPPRFFPSNPHAQTVLRSWLPARPSPLLVRRTLLLPDGDLLDLDILPPAHEPLDLDILPPAHEPAGAAGRFTAADPAATPRAADPAATPHAADPAATPGRLSSCAVILLHGLEGSSRRPYIQSMLNRIAAEGGIGVAMNFRGCGDSENRRMASYHAGWTVDLEEVVRWTAATFPDRRIGLVGFSLGAAITLNFMARSPMSDRVGGAAAISPPLDMRRIALHLQRGVARAYERYFLKSLREKTKAKQAGCPDYPSFTGDSLYDFDDQVTAPVHGFSSAEHYYEACSGRRFLPDLTSPTLLVHSLDDPICVMDRVEAEGLARHPMVRPCVTRRGGHVAFLTVPGGWLGTTVVEFLGSQVRP